jgi:hypothetical protein
LRQALALAAVLVALAGCAGASPIPGHDGVADVTVSELLANPTAYEGRRVRAHGYLVLKFESEALWADREARDARRYDRSIALRASGLSYARKVELSEQPASVTGVFVIGACGHLGARGAGLDDVAEIVSEGETVPLRTVEGANSVCFDFSDRP